MPATPSQQEVLATPPASTEQATSTTPAVTGMPVTPSQQEVLATPAVQPPMPPAPPPMPQGQGDYYIYAIPTPGESGQTEVRYQYVAVPKPVQAAPAAHNLGLLQLLEPLLSQLRLRLSLRHSPNLV